MAKDIKLYMNVILGFLHCVQHGLVRLFPIGQHPALITARDRTLRQVIEQIEQTVIMMKAGVVHISFSSDDRRPIPQMPLIS